LSSLNEKASTVFEVLEPVPESAGAWALRAPFAAAFGAGGSGQRQYMIPVRELAAERPAYQLTTKGKRSARKLHEKLNEHLTTMTVEEFRAEHKIEPTSAPEANAGGANEST
jgi:hypothetical protein